jgi:RNA polymerase sigma-70 factor (ECF subfamily)
MLPTSANRQPAAVGYRRGGDGDYQAYGLTVTTTGVARVASFGDPGLVPTFELPTVIAVASDGRAFTETEHRFSL